MCTLDKKAVIYGVRSGDTYHYIGKTIQINMKGEIPNSSVGRQYTNPEIRKVFEGNQVVVEELSSCNENEWYDEKLDEVVQKHGEQHPLLNAQWMLDGKRGYWEGTEGYWQGKTRDVNTLKQLSKSKYVKVCQYSETGVLLKIWSGAKEAAINVFGDYEVVNNSGKSALYHALTADGMKGRYKKGCYWFREKDLLNYFGDVPKKLNINKMIAVEKELRRQSHVNPEYASRYTVIQYNKKGEEINRFDNTHHCAFKLKIHHSMVQKFCRGSRYNSNYILKYGEKKLQKIGLDYGEYKINYKPDTSPKPSKAKPVERTRTKYSVDEYRNGVVYRSFNDVSDCAKQLGITENHVRYLCGNAHDKYKANRKNYYHLKYGKKIKVVI